MSYNNFKLLYNYINTYEMLYDCSFQYICHLSAAVIPVFKLIDNLEINLKSWFSKRKRVGHFPASRYSNCTRCDGLEQAWPLTPNWNCKQHRNALLKGFMPPLLQLQDCMSTVIAMDAYGNVNASLCHSGHTNS